MSQRKELISFEDKNATGLSVSFSLYKTLNTEVDLSPPTIDEFGGGIYHFQFDPETIPDDVVFIAEDTSGFFRIRGLLKKERYRKTTQNNFLRNANNQIISYVESVEEKHPVTGIREEIEGYVINYSYSGITLDEISKERLS